MPNPDTIALAAQAETEGLDAVLVGGNAVNLHAYFHTTFDVDLLVREEDAGRWLTFFQARGYAIARRTANFIRLRFEADPAAALPLDLMLANEHTFRKIRAESRRCEIGQNIALAIPSPLHLIAMKLHALRNLQRLEKGIDLLDVRHLIGRQSLMSPARSSSPSWSAMPVNPYDEPSKTNSETSRVREGAALFDLPEFDSLPATAGLTLTSKLFG